MSSSGPPEQGAAHLSGLVQARAEAAYLGLALGDALGATVEFMTPREIQSRYGVHREIRGGGWLNIKPGQVTDDTTMALALGRAILADGGEVRALSCARAFDDWMRSKPVDIGNTVRRNLITYRKTGNPEAPPSEHDAGNGAAMRVLPVALATFGQPPDRIAAACRAQGHVTHHNLLSDAACDTLVAMTHDFLAGNGLDAARQHANALAVLHPVFSWHGKRRDNPSGYVAETLQAVFQALFATDGFEACLVDVVNRGGDADTTGAIAGMLAGACYGPAAIPARWRKAVDAEIRQRVELQALALMKQG